MNLPTEYKTKARTRIHKPQYWMGEKFLGRHGEFLQVS